MTALCLQVRLDSSRLPEKALRKIEDFTLVEHAMRALRGIHADCFLLLTTVECVGRLEPLAKNCGFTVFAGPKEDVLLRFLQAAEKFNITTIIRATGDNPLVSASMANKVLEEHKSLPVEYTNWTGAPLGTGIEIVETEALKSAMMQTGRDYDHEHVTPWIYNNPALFHLNIKEVPEEYRNSSKVSVDTEDDLKKMEKIFKALYRGKPIELEDLMNYLKREDNSEK